MLGEVEPFDLLLFSGASIAQEIGLLAHGSKDLRYYGVAMDLQFLLDRYKWELDRREKISAAVNFPVTILILVFGLLGALLPKLQLVAPQVVLLVVGLFFLAGACGVVSLWHFIRSYQGSKYSYLPLLADLETTQEEWRAFYQEAHADGADEDFFAHEFRRHINRCSGSEYRVQRPAPGVS